MSNPPEVEDLCILSEKEVLKDGDEGANEIYYPLENKVAAFVTTDIGRAIVDLNRSEGDFSSDTKNQQNPRPYAQFLLAEVLE